MKNEKVANGRIIGLAGIIHFLFHHDADMEEKVNSDFGLLSQTGCKNKSSKKPLNSTKQKSI